MSTPIKACLCWYSNKPKYDYIPCAEEGEKSSSFLFIDKCLTDIAPQLVYQTDSLKKNIQDLSDKLGDLLSVNELFSGIHQIVFRL